MSLLALAQGEVPGTTDSGAAPSALTLIDLIHAGGVIGYIIIALSVAALALIVVHLIRIRQGALAPQVVVDELESLLKKGQVDAALAACERPENECFLATVMGAGLSRYRRSPFGVLELKGALEETGQEQVARLYRSTDALALIAGVAPMLGLLGTVVGLNGAFATIAATEGFAKPGQLAGDVSLALVTTIQGLLVAIPLMGVVAFFRNRIDSLAGDVATIVDDLAALVETAAAGGAMGSPAPSRAGGPAAMSGGGPAGPAPGGTRGAR